jgi:hypothetical protein
MLSRHLSLALVLSLMCMAGAEPASAQSAPGGNPRLAEEVKQNIPRLGLGREARIMVMLRDNRKLAGYVSQVGADSFTLINEGTGAPTAVLYTQVQRISGGNRSTGAFFSIPEPKPKEAPKWLKGVAKGAKVVLGVGATVLLMSRL